MRKFFKPVLVVLLIGVMIFAGSSCDKNEGNAFTSGTYSYKGYDLDDKQVTEGQIDVTVEDSLIEGAKDIVEINIGGTYSMEAGAGIIEGFITEDGTIDIALMESDGPYMIIRGEFKNGLLKGKRYWGISGGAPETVIGTFESQRIK